MRRFLKESDVIIYGIGIYGNGDGGGEGALTRKSPIGITKAIALSNYNQDLAFYANHNFVHRMQDTGKKANPNPINKEEHSGLFKLSFTLDADMIGKDSWVVDNYSFNNNGISIKIAEPQKFVFGNCEINNQSRPVLKPHHPKTLIVHCAQYRVFCAH